MSDMYPTTPIRSSFSSPHPPALLGRKRPPPTPSSDERQPRSRRATLSTSTLQLQLLAASISSSPLLPAAPVLPSTERREVPVDNSNEVIRRSPGLRNLNIFTRYALAEDHELPKASCSSVTTSRELPNLWSRRDHHFQDALSSPELPDSPESPYRSEEDFSDSSEDDLSSSNSEMSSDEDESDDGLPSPCVARRVVGEISRARLIATPTRGASNHKGYSEDEPMASPTFGSFKHLPSPSSTSHRFVISGDLWERRTAARDGAEIRSWRTAQPTQGLGFM